MTRLDRTHPALGRKGRLTAGLALCTSLACLAQSDPPARPTSNQIEAKDKDAEKETSSPIRYVYGLSVHANEQPGGKLNAKIKPQLGLQWGRWRLGLNPEPQAWSALSTIRREPTVGYEAVKASKLRMVVGLRLHNITTGDGFNALESGRLTLRGRLYASYQWSPKWSLATELTHDLQNRGDGQTITLAASRSWNLSSKDVLSWGAGIKWADAEHWRTPYTLDPTLPAAQLALANQLGSGWGSMSTGLAYRRTLADNLVFVGGINASRPVGHLTDIAGTRLNIGAQVGLLWFGKW
jgi:hypothetical protein